MVAAARAIATRAENPLITDPFAEPLTRAVGVEFFDRWVTGELDAAEIDDTEAGWRLADMPDAMAVRTRYFDAFFAEAADAGIRQAVILAAGLDARAYRLAWPADMTVFEVDQPQVLEFKATALAGLGAEPATDRRTVPIDLRRDWPAALVEAGFDPAVPTAWIAEGLLGYLPPDAQDALLDNITAHSVTGSRLAVEGIPDVAHLDTDQLRDRMRQATAKWRDYGFDLEFADLGYVGDRHDVGEYLQRLGWQSTATTARQLFADNGLATVPAAPDSVSMADTVYYTSTLS
jgi:methyltransferase (TIGR00027 family)